MFDLSNMGLKWSDYIPHNPSEIFAKQLAFLLLPHREAFYGGAAGGGKSEALLLAALQYVDVPGYSAIIFRRTLADLKQANALLDRANNWLGDSPARYAGDEHCWYFPTRYPDGTKGVPARLQFGYIGTSDVRTRYKSAEYQFCGFDELTTFMEVDYLFMFSRLRRIKCPDHDIKKPDPNCYRCNTSAKVPIRMRAASNPGDRGHCVTHGEVLTPSGWTNIKRMKIGEPVYTVKSDGELVLSKVSQVHKRRYKGKLAVIEGKGFSLEATPQHKMLKVGGTKTDRDKLFSLVPIEELPGQANLLRAVSSWKGQPHNGIRLPVYSGRKSKHDQPLTLPANLYLQLLGWFLAEGHVVKRDQAVGISQMKVQHRETIQNLLDQCGFVYSVSDSGFTIYSREWYQHFAQFGKQPVRFVPTDVKNATEEELRLLLTAMLAGDGHARSETGADYYTTSERLANDVQEIAVKLGYVTNLFVRKRANRSTYEHKVSIRMQGKSTEVLTGQHKYNVDTNVTKPKHLSYRKHNGYVYCIGVEETNTFVLRQDGCVWLSGNSWVKEHFSIGPKVIDGITRYVGMNPERPYIAANFRDNPFVDQDEYEMMLDNMDPISREQFKNGDWGVSQDSRFKMGWFRRYSWRGDYLILGPDGRGEGCLRSDLQIFVTVDTAASAKEGPGDDKRFQVQRSWTVICVWGVTPDHHLVLLDVVRVRVEIPDILNHLIEVCRKWRPSKIGMEAVGTGKGAYQMAARRGLPVFPLHPHTDKIQRSTEAMVRAEQGRIWLPQNPGPGWLPAFEGEVSTWTGDPSEVDDQIDCLSYAATMVSWEAAGIEMEAMDLGGSDAPDCVQDSSVHSYTHDQNGIPFTVPFYHY